MTGTGCQRLDRPLADFVRMVQYSNGGRIGRPQETINIPRLLQSPVEYGLAGISSCYRKLIWRGIRRFPFAGRPIDNGFGVLRNESTVTRVSSPIPLGITQLPSFELGLRPSSPPLSLFCQDNFAEGGRHAVLPVLLAAIIEQVYNNIARGSCPRRDRLLNQRLPLRAHNQQQQYGNQLISSHVVSPVPGGMNTIRVWPTQARFSLEWGS